METMPARSSGKALYVLLGVAVLIALVAFAFTLGMHFAGPSPVVPTLPIDDTQDDIANDPQMPPIIAHDGELDVMWYDAPEERPFNFYLRQEWEGLQENVDISLNRYTARVLGLVAPGEAYEGYEVVEATVTRATEIGGDNVVRFYLLQEQKSDRLPVVLTRYTVQELIYNHHAEPIPNLFASYTGNEVIMSDVTIWGLDAPEVLVASQDSYVLDHLGPMLPTDSTERQQVLAGYPVTTQAHAQHDISQIYGLRLYAEDLESNIFFGTPNDLFIVLPNGRTAWYAVDLPIWDETGSPMQTPSLVWNDGSAVSEYMRGEIAGCGFSSSTNVAEEIPSLAIAGYAQSDVERLVYTPADYTDALLADDYGMWSSMGRMRDENANVSIEAFAREKPVFYMQDGLERWIKFVNSQSIPPGECGKPVIYLYPEETTDLTVTLAPKGGFTKTEPVYDDGWNVTAQPNGTLRNHADGQTYPYLFWEGRGGLYSEPRQFWVVARADVPDFLVRTLTDIGFNAQEIADFMEFWVPRMQSAPYYKIGFHGTAVMDHIAPLTISQKPDAILRVLMDYTELLAPIAENPPTLRGPFVRKGFTVVEWGGVLR